MADLEGSVTLDDILGVVKARSGLDFTRYRRKTIERRTAGRMLLAHCADNNAYLRLLESDPKEVDRLVERLTIKVSWFFRDAQVFALLREQVVPDLRQRAGGEGLRIWSAGCGNGEEAYSLAILLRQGTPDWMWPAHRICATDVDEAALAAARRGIYPCSELSETPEEVAAAYLAPVPGGMCPSVQVDASLRAAVQFLRHDLTVAEGPPLGQPFHLILCRNVLIYFGRELQQHTQHLLRRSLAPGGYLCLGEAEWLLPELQGDFEVIERRARVFRLKE